VLNREAQTVCVGQRKGFLAKQVPEMEEEIAQLRKDLQKMLDKGGDQLNPSGKYYALSEKLVK